MAKITGNYIPMRAFAKVSGRNILTIRITVNQLIKGLWGKENITDLLQSLDKAGEER